MKRLSFLTLLVGLLGLAVYMTQAAIIGGTEAELREVIDYMTSGEVTIAGFPANSPLDFDLPLPENTQILASIIQDNYFRYDESQVVLTLMLQSENLSALEIGEFYQSYFSENDWQEILFSFDEQVGFNGSDTMGGQYCYPDEYYLSFSIWDSVNSDSALDWDMTIYTHPDVEQCQMISIDEVPDPATLFPNSQRWLAQKNSPISTASI